MKKRSDFMGWLQDNRGDPSLRMGHDVVCDAFETLEDYLPDKVRLAVKVVPHFMRDPVLLEGRQCQKSHIYARHDILHSLSLKVIKEGMHPRGFVFYGGHEEVIHHDEDLVIGTQDVLVTMPFKVLHNGQKLAGPITTLPFGGSFHQDPLLCRQLFVEVREEFQDITLSILSDTLAKERLIQKGYLWDYQSLADWIMLKKIALTVMFRDQKFPYVSSGYCLHHSNFFYLDFIKNF